MLAHGADPDSVDEVTFRQIVSMYADGLIGNHGILETLGNLSAGVYNYLRPQNKSPYKLKDLIPRAYDYIYPPQDTTENPSNSLLAYMAQAKGFEMKRFKVDK
jgi:hypothetical protein